MSLKENITSNKQENNDSSAWLVSFADLLSLMLTFFVLLYSMSDIPQKKWSEYSSSIVEYITGSKLNIFKQKTAINKQQKTSSLSDKKASHLSYIVTLLDGTKIDNQPIKNFVTYQIDQGSLIINLDKNIIDVNEDKITITQSGENIFLGLSKIFKTLNNQISVSFPSNNYELSIKLSNFIARNIEEFGYEYKVLREIYFYNEALTKTEISDKFQIIITINENIF